MAAFLLFLVFLVLKLCGVIAWSWLWVTAPLWLGTALVLGCGLLALAGLGGFVGLTSLFSSFRKKR